MNELLQQIPEFWRGVAASIVAAMIIAIVGLILRIFGQQLGTWRERRRTHSEALQTALKEGNYLVQTTVSIQFIFKTLQHLFLANILWVMPEAIGSIIDIQLVYTLKFLSLLFFFLGLRWIAAYSAAAVIPKTASKAREKEQEEAI